MAKVYFRTYGCTLNQADTEIMEALAMKEGHEIVDESKADVIVVNTCTVKASTENKIMHYLRKLKSQNKRFVIAGCMSVNKSLVDFKVPIVSAGSIMHINKAIEDALSNKQSFYLSHSRKDNLPKVFTPPIARIPIEDGCLNACYFCQTKLARPGLRSQSHETIKHWIKQGLSLGCKEFDLTGMDTGAYGFDIKSNIVKLLKDVLSMEGDFMIRLGMINPQHVKRMLYELIDVFRDKRMFKFLHVPVQSGSNKVLREMNRGHTVEDFEEAAKAFRKAFNATIATDIIVGYPTETDEDFEETLELIKRVKPDIVNLSKFTPRKGTKAALMKQLPTQIIKARSVKAAKVIDEVIRQRNKEFEGKIFDVLITEKGKGRTKTYKQVVVDGKIGSWVKVKIIGSSKTSLFAENVKQS